MFEARCFQWLPAAHRDPAKVQGKAGVGVSTEDRTRPSGQAKALSQLFLMDKGVCAWGPSWLPM